MGATFAALVNDGSLLVAIAIAALVGAISFASPCVLPLVPGYLAYVAGLTGAHATPASTATAAPAPGVGQPVRLLPATSDAAPSAAAEAAGLPVQTTGTGSIRSWLWWRSGRGRVMTGASLFVAGFSVVFLSFGAAFGGLGRLLLEWSPVITRVMGGVTIVMGVAFLGGLRWLQRDNRIHRRPPAGLLGAPLLGVVFGLGWTPCLGPTLSAVNTLAYSEASATRGAILAFAYCLGLGVPFLLIASGATRALALSRLARRHARTITAIGGTLLIVLGVLLLTGTWDALMIWMRAWLATTGLGTSAV